MNILRQRDKQIDFNIDIYLLRQIDKNIYIYIYIYIERKKEVNTEI